jgi:hypothetical protein
MPLFDSSAISFAYDFLQKVVWLYGAQWFLVRVAFPSSLHFEIYGEYSGRERRFQPQAPHKVGYSRNGTLCSI